MTTQRVIFTACPNGVTSTGKLRISVAIGPQLMPSPAITSPTLADFPDWLHWPGTKITWKVTIGSHVVNAKVVSAAPQSLAYGLLFTSKTPVRPYKYESPTSRPLYTYPTAYMRSFVQRMYGKLALNLPKGDGLHSYQDLTGQEAFGQLPVDSRQMADLMTEVAFAFTGPGPLPVQKSQQSVAFAMAQAAIFLQQQSPQDILQKPQSKSRAITPAAVPVPKHDFHDAYTLLQRHPALLRLLGFVVDLEVPRPAGLATTVPLSVEPAWHPKLAGTTNVSPVTMTSSGPWRAAPRTTNPEIAGGLLRLSDPGAYDVVEVDVDGAAFKALNFVQAIFNAHTQNPSADTPHTYGAPALRSAGLSLSKIGHAVSVFDNWMNNDAFNNAFLSSPPGTITLYAEDIAQGYRIDVWTKSRKRWFQLFARSADPRIGGYGIGKPRHVYPVPAGDEGWIEPSTTQSPTAGPSDPVYLPETLLRWHGWSQIAPRPGKHLSDNSADSLQEDTGNIPPADSHFQVQIQYVPTPGTLPTLRFGEKYRFRARVVDLAGNSLPFGKHAPFAFTTPAASYGRLEPVASPVLVPCAPRTPGESLETLVIRSNYDIPDNSRLIIPSERHIAPPASSIEMIEAHGALDDARGVPRKGAYSMLAGRDGLTYKTHSVLTRFGGKIDRQLINGKNEWIYYPPAAHPTRAHPAFGVPYLPDVLGRGVVLHGLPGAGHKPVVVRFDEAGAWPDLRVVRLVVHAGGKHPTLPRAHELDGAVNVYAPKASVTTVRMSSWFEPGRISDFKLWEWLHAQGSVRPELRQTILDGLHYMFTPFRELTIVHAVRQPLQAPRVHHLTRFRSAGTTYALLSGDLRAHPASTQRVDLLSSYSVPYDDGVSASGIVFLRHRARVAEFPLASGQSGTIKVPDVRHDFGDTKHYLVYYQLLSTTRFLEYFTETSKVALKGTNKAVVSHRGFVPGTVTVHGTGRHASQLYTAGVDYAEDDRRGTIARLAHGKIPNHATVQVQFVVPPVTRSSLEPVAHPPAKQGYLVSIPSSARPPAPVVRYLIPAFGWGRKASPHKVTSVRYGNTLRVYLGRPWFQSGDGELLGVVVFDSPHFGALPPALTPLVTGYGQDPVFVTGKVTTPKVTDFTLAVRRHKGLLLAEQEGTGDNIPYVDVAGHNVSWDRHRKLWFADIEMRPGSSYFPFVKLALVRYQPDSLHGLELSNVVQADFMQVAPNRAVTLTFPSASKVKVVVAGPGYRGSVDPFTPSVMRAYVQEPAIKTADPDLRWRTVPSSAAGFVLKVASQTASQTVWEGSVALPAPRAKGRFRILVAEYEQHGVVEQKNGIEPPNAPSRVTYLDALEI